jgi:MFS family permease
MLAFFVTFFARLVFSPVVPFIVEDFAISNTEIGFALTGMWLAYGLSQYPSGVLADRFGEKSIVLLAVGGTALAAMVIAVVPIFAVFAFFAVLLGALAGLEYSVATVLLSRTFDDMGMAVSVHSLGAPLAGLLAPIAGAWVGIHFGWQAAIALAVVLSIPVFALIAWRVRPTEPRHPDRPVREGFELSTVVPLLRQQPVLFSLGLAITATFVLNGTISFLPTFIVNYRDQSTAFAGLVFSGYFVARGGFQLLVGHLSDRYDRDLALGICMLASAAGLTTFVYLAGFSGVIVAALMTGLGAAYFPALDPRFLDVIGEEEEKGSEFGLVRTIYVMVGSTGSIGVGLLADLYGWATAFLVLAALSALVAVALLANWVLDFGY